MNDALRAVGFTDEARRYPRDDLALRMFAAFNGVTVDQLPEGFRYFPNEWTAMAWERVADVARQALTVDLSHAQRLELYGARGK